MYIVTLRFARGYDAQDFVARIRHESRLSRKPEPAPLYEQERDPAATIDRDDSQEEDRREKLSEIERTLTKVKECLNVMSAHALTKAGASPTDTVAIDSSTVSIPMLETLAFTPSTSTQTFPPVILISMRPSAHDKTMSSSSAPTISVVSRPIAKQASVTTIIATVKTLPISPSSTVITLCKQVDTKDAPTLVIFSGCTTLFSPKPTLKAGTLRF